MTSEKSSAMRIFIWVKTVAASQISLFLNKISGPVLYLSESVDFCNFLNLLDLSVCCMYLVR